MTMADFFEKGDDLYIMVPEKNFTPEMKKDIKKREWLESELVPDSYSFFEILESNFW